MFGSLLDSLPVEGSITSEFGARTHPTTGKEETHTGVDINAKEGTEVKAVFDGIVEDSSEDKSLGLMLVINHGNGYKTRYGHLSKINVEKGKSIKKGDIIALTGNTGVSTGPHLHFEVEVNGKNVNPLEFIKAKSQ
jgi:murein DD-endopeptidase MepM/ murein hydrolase activator NlpD